MGKRIFVSHSNYDNAWCRELVASLRAFGFDVWYDEQDIPLGGRFPDIIGREIEQREVFIVVLTPDAWRSDWVQKEIALAQADPHLIIPVMLQPTAITGFLRVQQHIVVNAMTPQQIAERLCLALGEVAVPSPTSVSLPPAPQYTPSSGFTGMLRRLPVYLLIDCSAAMAGAPIIAVNEGLELLYRELMRDPQARETAWISLIRFADRASQDALTPIDQFVPPSLHAGGGRSMGAALTLLEQSVRQDLMQTTGAHKGDYCPLVLLLTSGNASDEIRSPIAAIKQLRGPKKPTIVALACGQDANPALLAELTDKVYMMGTVTMDELRSFFKLTSGSIAPAAPIW